MTTRTQREALRTHPLLLATDAKRTRPMSALRTPSWPK